jgi:hypothetical protein
LNEELEDALLFFSLPKAFTKEELKRRYRELALKYHPDRGEYTSDVLFVQLMNYYSYLENYLNLFYSESFGVSNDSVLHNSNQKITKDEYKIYKEIKTRESESILYYFKSRKNLPSVELDPKKNPELNELRVKLDKIKKDYNEFIKLYPNSIWVADILDSIENLKVWWK